MTEEEERFHAFLNRLIDAGVAIDWMAHQRGTRTATVCFRDGSICLLAGPEALLALVTYMAQTELPRPDLLEEMLSLTAPERELVPGASCVQWRASWLYKQFTYVRMRDWLASPPL